MESLKKRVDARGQGGFTLIELLVVIAILAILAGVVVFAVGASTDNAGLAACKTERSSLVTAFNAADVANKSKTVGAADETYAAYLTNDADIKYFTKADITGWTTGSAITRSAGTTGDVSNAAGDGCEDIAA